MALSVEKTGKTIDEAREAALAELGAKEDEVAFEILEEPSKGFFGLIGSKPAKIRATIIERERGPIDKAYDLLKQIFEKMNLDVTIEKKETEDGELLTLVGENLGILIGKHGQTLDALQYVANLAANKGREEDRVRVIVDVEGYRERREETLKTLASRLAEKARRTGQKIMLEPMNRHERKIIHMALQDDSSVSTYSSGDEPFRKVVIEPKNRRRGGFRKGYRRDDRFGHGEGGYRRRRDSYEHSESEKVDDREVYSPDEKEELVDGITYAGSYDGKAHEYPANK